MGWFDEQIKQRMKSDDEAFSAAFADMASVVTGKNSIVEALNGDRKNAKDAIDAVLKYYHAPSTEIPETIKDMNEQLEYAMRPTGIMRRTVVLSGKWWKHSVGAFLAQTTEGEVVAVLPRGISGYEFFSAIANKRVHVNGKTAKLLNEEAICFYKPLPLKSLGIKDLIVYIVRTLSIADFVAIGFATLAVTLLGLLLPKINFLIFSDVIASESMRILIAVAVLLLGVTVSSMLMNVFKSMIMGRIQIKMNISVQAASMMRVMSLPAEFFKKYSAGELSQRAQSINSLCSMLANVILTTGLTSVFSLVYISQIFNYAPMLVVPALVIIVVTVLYSVISTLVQMKISKKQMELGAKESGLTYQLISGVQKIKLAGAEKRAFAKWAAQYKKGAAISYNPPWFIKLNGVISMAISSIGMLVMYYFSLKSQIGVAEYYAFNTAYGMVSGAFASMASMALTFANIKPVFDMVEPILKTVPEVSEGKKVITRLSGGIELNNVSFRYAEGMPLVLDNLSLKIRPGQYIAIVGKTGCGKSTLLRILLGFEKPQKGAVYFDGKDLDSVDLKSLRQKIGTVLQNGKLFQGDIYSNIIISAPQLTLDQAWEAAELAGIAEDIRNMPMGMHTVISEGSGGVSGGQRQRLMIARAIASKPKILIFDEATSALDNLTQKVVSDSLEKLRCTRIVVAHRLSTIKQCDRIIVLDKGVIAEDGSYGELLEKNGAFAELVRRQRLDEVQENDV